MMLDNKVFFTAKRTAYQLAYDSNLVMSQPQYTHNPVLIFIDTLAARVHCQRPILGRHSQRTFGLHKRVLCSRCSILVRNNISRFR